MKCLLSSLASLILSSVALQAAADPGWLMPVDNESFGIHGPVSDFSAGVECQVEFPNAITNVEFYVGTEKIGSTNSSRPSSTPGKKVFASRLFFSVAGDYTITAKGSDGFLLHTLDGPSIHLLAVAPPATFEAEAANEISPVRANLRTRVNTHGLRVSSAYFQYGPTAAYGQTTGSFFYPTQGDNFAAIRALIGNLQPETSYHYRLVVTTTGIGRSSGGTYYGPDTVFTTAVNQAPVTRPDIGVLRNGTSCIVPCLSNDADDSLSTPDDLTLVSVTNGAHGTVEIGTLYPPSVRYTAGPGFTDTDTFTYRVADQFGAESEGTVEIRSLAVHRIELAGSYNTTLYSGGVNDIVGSLSLTVNPLGSFSGSINIRGLIDSFTGVLQEGEYDTNSPTLSFFVPGFGTIRWGFTIFHNHDGIPTVVGGLISGVNNVYFDITPGLQLIPPSELVQEEGIYNLALPNPNENGAYADTQPQGDGFATMRISRKGGRMATTGRTGDGQPFSAGGRLRQDRNILVSAASGVSRKARLNGLMGFDLSEERSSGDLVWNNKARNRGLYATSFQMNIKAHGEKFVPPARNTPIFSFGAGVPTNVDIEVRNHDGVIVSADTTPLVKNRLDTGASDPSRVRIAINPRNGLFKGTLVEPGKKPVRLMGIVQPETGVGVGVAGPTGADGSVRLSVPSAD